MRAETSKPDSFALLVLRATGIAMHSMSFQFIFIVGLIFAVAGCVKGVVGMGLPTFAIGLLGWFTKPAQAAALLIIPSLITNVWQFIAGPHRVFITRRMWSMLLSICIATWAASGLITRSGATHADTALGGALIVYGALGIAKVRMSVAKRLEIWLSPMTGLFTGVVTGATGVLTIPAVPYLQALELEKEDLVQALGLSFTMSTVALAAGLASRGAFHIAAAGFSTLCIIPALAGMSFGNWIRGRINSETFRIVFFVGLLLLGVGLILRESAL
jgi:uncharacterized protein